MKKKFSIQKIVLLLVAGMLTVIPNMTVYSSVGGYTSSSAALTANNYSVQTRAVEDAALPAALAAAAEAIGLAYAAGYVVGTIAHHVYNAFGAAEVSLAMAAQANYDPYDFSKFDN
jgi:hypothetical protein